MAHPAIIDQPLMWKCQCGGRVFAHYEHCPACGTEKPAPVAEKPADIEPMKEPPAP